MHDTLFTTGHSNHSIERFLELLRGHGITAVGDVRSNPYSRYNPQFNRETLQQSLQQAGIAYRFLGDQLGASCSDPACFENGKVLLSRVARTMSFRNGLEQVRAIMAEKRLALMCAEKDPLMCHRTVLVCRNLRNGSLSISHILADGSLETQAELEMRLLALMKVQQDDLFLGREQLIDRAYDLLEDRMFSPPWGRGQRSGR